MFSYQKWITRQDLRNNPDVLYVFGDNLERRGFGGLAKECRGEPNAVGIPTKKKPSHGDYAYFSNNDFRVFSDRLRVAFKLLENHLNDDGDVVWPTDGIGTGLAYLEEKAPDLWKSLEITRQFLEENYSVPLQSQR